MTKPITSTAIMMLVEAGKLRLSDSVHKYIPSFNTSAMHVHIETDKENDTYARADVKEDITIQHLLTHTAGLSHGIDFLGLVCPVDALYARAGLSGVPSATTADTMAEYVDRVAAMPLVHQPGAEWHYSVGPDVLGRIVEVPSIIRNFFLRTKMMCNCGVIDMCLVCACARVVEVCVCYVLWAAVAVISRAHMTIDC